MSTQPFRFSLKWLLFTMGIVAVLLAGSTSFFKAVRRAQIEAMKDDYLWGRMSLEEARKHAGDVVDSWPAPK